MIRLLIFLENGHFEINNQIIARLFTKFLVGDWGNTYPSNFLKPLVKHYPIRMASGARRRTARRKLRLMMKDPSEEMSGGLARKATKRRYLAKPR